MRSPGQRHAPCYVPGVLEPSLTAGLWDMLVFFLWVMVAALIAAIIVGWVAFRRVRKFVTTGGGFWQTLREVPFALVAFIDLLDLGLGTFSAPIIWVMLKRMGLLQLREVATIEAIIPFSGPIPTMTICWLLARIRKDGRPLLGRGDFEARGMLQAEQVAPGKWQARP